MPTKAKGIPKNHQNKGAKTRSQQVSVRLDATQIDGLSSMAEDYRRKPGYPPVTTADLLRWAVKDLLEKHRQSKGHKLANG